VVRLEGVIAVAAVGVAAGIGTAAVVRLFDELRCLDVQLALLEGCIVC